MERLTKLYDAGCGFINGCYDEYGDINQEMVANRLAAYEDTGLTPEEVDHIVITLRNNHFKNINDLLVAWSRRFDENATLRNELCLKCGNYKTAHEGSCNGCRWKKGE